MNLLNMEASIGRKIDDVCKKVADLESQFRDTGPHLKVEEKMRAVDAKMACLSGQSSSLVSEGGLQKAAMEDQLGEVEHALSDPEQLPSVVMKVKELLRTVSGDAGCLPGAGIDARFHASRIRRVRSICCWALAIQQTVLLSRSKRRSPSFEVNAHG
jgi:hypothetical protein